MSKLDFYNVLILLLVLPFNLLAQDNCNSSYRDISIQSKIADAGFFANVRGKEGSVSVESNSLLTKAEELITSQTPPQLACPKGCSLAKLPVIHFQSIPQKFLKDSSDSDYCKTLENSTMKEPIQYSKSDITSIKELNDWIGELSQGKGKEGGDLYKKCDKSCSPQYEYKIERASLSDSSKTAKASIICGPARDKDDDMYKLTAFFRWSCVAA